MTTTPEDSQDVLDLLVAEHRQVEELLAALEGADAPTVRAELRDELVAQIVRHSVAEEAYVYPVVREHVPNGAEAVEHDMEEHDELEHLLKRLEGLDPADPAFDVVLHEVRTTLADHIADEEIGQFPQLRAVTPADELVALREKVQRIESLAPTRPHPSAPNSQLFHKLVGPGVGMVDRLRDALSGRLAS
ncbi:MAG TPA: hemerythrin domain-containing protein [Candidatus Nanopelagicales bacterium]